MSAYHIPLKVHSEQSREEAVHDVMEGSESKVFEIEKAENCMLNKVYGEDESEPKVVDVEEIR